MVSGSWKPPISRSVAFLSDVVYHHSNCWVLNKNKYLHNLFYVLKQKIYTEFTANAWPCSHKNTIRFWWKKWTIMTAETAILICPQQIQMPLTEKVKQQLESIKTYLCQYSMCDDQCSSNTGHQLQQTLHYDRLHLLTRSFHWIFNWYMVLHSVLSLNCADLWAISQLGPKCCTNRLNQH